MLSTSLECPMLESRRLRELDLEKVILTEYCEIKDGVRKANLCLGLLATNPRTKRGAEGAGVQGCS